jgi:hypothetical protein
LSARLAQLLNSFPTVFHNAYTQDLVIDSLLASLILCVTVVQAAGQTCDQRLGGSTVTSRAIVIGLFMGVAVVPLTFIPAGSAHGASAVAWQSATAPGMRPQFRPWHPRVASRPTESRWRPHRSGAFAQPAARYPTMVRQAPVITQESRYTAPVTRAFSRTALSGTRFRPHGRATDVAASRVETTPRLQPGGPELHAQFRPAPIARRVTYEELHGQPPAPSAWRPYGGPYAYPPVTTARAGTFR